jgi:hypothetical protein
MPAPDSRPFGSDAPPENGGESPVSTHRNDPAADLGQAHFTNQVIDAECALKIVLVRKHQEGHIRKGREREERVKLGRGCRDGSSLGDRVNSPHTIVDIHLWRRQQSCIGVSRASAARR